LDFWERLSKDSLFLDETETRLEVDHAQVEQFYLPLAENLIARLLDHARLVIGVAGPPGCGKSAFSALLATVINARTAQDISCQDPACAVSMDGWHFPNSYLDHHTILRSGEMVLLSSIKGAPETFDAQAMLTCLAAIREGGTVDYPVYSRRLHDPIPNGGHIRHNQRYVIVEGNYLFLNESPWDALRPTFDVRIFVKASLQAIQAGLLERHLRGGKTPELAQRQIQEVDLPNAERVLTGSIPASIMVHKLDSKVIQSINWFEDQPLA
jgi:putative kinase